jgi:hypothetical protein
VTDTLQLSVALSTALQYPLNDQVNEDLITAAFDDDCGFYAVLKHADLGIDMCSGTEKAPGSTFVMDRVDTGLCFNGSVGTVSNFGASSFERDYHDGP